MPKPLRAVIGPDGQVRLREAVSLQHECRAIVTILDDEAACATALLSEAALAEDWNRPEEGRGVVTSAKG